MEIKDVPLSVERCVHCGRVRLAGRWLVRDDNKLRELVEKRAFSRFGDVHASATIVDEAEKSLSMRLEAIVSVDGESFLLDRTLSVAWDDTQCDACMRIRSDYFEAKLQLRASSSDVRVEEAHRRVLAFFAAARKTDSLADIQAMGRVKNGFDYRIGSKKAAGGAADDLVRGFSAEKIVSKKLHSFADGRPEYRFTFLVRLRPVSAKK